MSMSESSTKTQKKEWEGRICKQRESGLCIEEWCRQNKLSSHQFHYWKKRLFPKNRVDPNVKTKKFTFLVLFPAYFYIF